MQRSLPAGLRTPPGADRSGAAVRAPAVAAFCVALALAVFVFDLSTPKGIADGIPYLLVVLCSAWLPWRAAPFALAALTSALLIGGYAVSAPGVDGWFGMSNRALALGALWIAAWLCSRQIETMQQLRRAAGARRLAEQKIEELQSKLYRMARRGELGELTSAIAHELNQPLTAARSYVAAAQRLMPRGDTAVAAEADAAMRKAMEQTDRAAEVLRHIRRLLGSGESSRSLEDVNTVVAEATEFALIGTRPLGIAVDLDLAPDLPKCLVNRTQIFQVLLNLVRNSVDALSGCERGALRVRTRATGNGGICISIADTGPGLAPEVREKLFMPFVSTKPEGIGIGLSVSHSIAEAHGGRLSAAPNPGGGTVFELSLPAPRAAGRGTDARSTH